ncbi:hypothetical protein IVB27_19870 [Bradyrhizobium sp. 197]|uniref:hypothetical protein n=1 Tax=Bradyrhizobium sp. 197 TaxID=2782663 RepID=UPI001FF78FA0|nr:hypothetical protein [Bradyrhizobium sp. 197]MCK1477005.1 hypothetical protein [Bradyrhizobium sp. 197]
MRDKSQAIVAQAIVADERSRKKRADEDRSQEAHKTQQGHMSSHQSRQGIALDKRNQEQPIGKRRAQDSSSENISGAGSQSDEDAGKVPEPEHRQRDPKEKK